MDKIMNNQDSKRILSVTITGAVINVFLSFSKIAGGYYGNSQALVADGVHSMSDLVSDAILLVGLRFWSSPSDECHPHGHRRIENLVTMIIGLILLLVGLKICYDAVINLGIRHEAVKPATYTVWFALISICSKEWLYQYTVSAGKKLKSASVIANAWHHRSDAFSSVPVLISLLMAYSWPEYGFMDEIGALIVAVIIMQVSFSIMYDSFIRLADKAATAQEIESIMNIGSGIDGVREIHKVRTRYLGSALEVDLHMLVDGSISVSEGHRISENLKRRLIESGPGIVDVIVHIEPFEKESADQF